MLNSTRFASPPASGPHIAPAMIWAEKNLGALARFTTAQMDGGDGDHVHLAATFGLLKARQQIRQGLRDVELQRRAVA